MKWMHKKPAAEIKLPANEVPTSPLPEALAADTHQREGELASPGAEAPEFIAAANYIMDADRAKGLKTIVEHTIGSVAKAVPYLLKSETFDDFLSNAGLKLTIDEAVQVSLEYNPQMLAGGAFGVAAHNNPLDYDRAVFVVAANRAIYMNRAAHWHFAWSHTTFKKQQKAK